MVEIQFIQFGKPTLIQSDSPEMLGALAFMAAKLEPETHVLTRGSRVCLEDLGITITYASSVGVGPTACVADARANRTVWINNLNPTKLIGRQETGGFKVFGVVTRIEKSGLDDLRALEV